MRHSKSRWNSTAATIRSLFSAAVILCLTIGANALPIKTSKIATGIGFSVAIRDNNGVGEVYTAGLNDVGQLGINDLSVKRSNAPRKVSFQPGTNIIAVSASKQHAIALDASGVVYQWGKDPAQVITAPTAVLGLTDVTAIFAGPDRNFACRLDGSLYTWNASTTPSQVPGITNVAVIRIGDDFQIAMTTSGAVYYWQYRVPPSSGLCLTPTLFPGLPANVIDIATSSKEYFDACYFLTSAGELYFSHAQVVLSPPNLDVPKRVVGAVPPSQVVGLYNLDDVTSYPEYPQLINNQQLTIILKCADGRFRVLQGGTHGEYYPLVQATYTPIALPASEDFSGSTDFIMSRDLYGRVWTAGSGDGIGVGLTTRPSQISGLKNVTKLLQVTDHGAALVQSGTTNKLYVWKSPASQFPAGSVLPIEVTIPSVIGFKDVAIGLGHILALTDTGDLYAWGANNYGQCATPTTTPYVLNPTSIRGLVAPTGTTISKIYSSESACFAILSNGRVRSWGHNYFGILGSGNQTDRSTPGYVNTASGTILEKVVEIAPTDEYVLFRIDSSGAKSVRATGFSYYLPSSVTSTYAKYATTLTGLTGATAIRAGGVHSLVSVGSSLYSFGGTVWFGAAGAEPAGGYNSGPIYLIPGTGSFSNCFATAASCYIVTSTGIKAWGGNSFGALGNDDSSESFVFPVPANNSILLNGFESIIGNLDPYVTSGIKSSASGRTAWAWGNLRGDPARYYRKEFNHTGVWHAPLNQFAMGSPIPEFDANGNLLGDDWEAANSVQGALATADLDGDGLTNLQEYHLNTNPTAADSDGDLLNDLASDRVRYQPFTIPRMRLPSPLTEDQAAPTIMALVGTTFPVPAVTPVYTVTSSPKATVTITALDSVGPQALIRPVVNQNGESYFEYTVAATVNGVTYTNSGRVDYTINSVVDLPIAHSQTLLTQEGTPLNIVLTGSDPDGQTALEMTVKSLPIHGTISGTVPNLTYTPFPNYSTNVGQLPDSFTFEVRAGSRISALAKVEIRVENTDNDLPVVLPQIFDAQEDEFVGMNFTVVDPEGETLYYSLAEGQGPSHGTIVKGGAAATSQYFYTGDWNYFGPDSFTYKVADRFNDPTRTVHGDVQIRVAPVNDPPSVLSVQPAQYVFPGESIPFAIVHASDVDSVLTYSVKTPPTLGTLVHGLEAGHFTYENDVPVATGLDFAVIEISDGFFKANTRIDFFIGGLDDGQSQSQIVYANRPNGNPIAKPSGGEIVRTSRPLFSTIEVSGGDARCYPNLEAIYTAGDSFPGSEEIFLYYAGSGQVLVRRVHLRYTPIRWGFDPTDPTFAKSVMERSDDGYVHAGTQRNRTGDGGGLLIEEPALIPFGFQNSVNFYGVNRSGVYIANNGNWRFSNLSDLQSFTPTLIREGEIPMIAPFWADVDTRISPVTSPGTYGTTTAECVIPNTSGVVVRPAFATTWVRCNYFVPNGNASSEKINTFQVVIIDRSADFGAGNFDLEFNYERIEWEAGDESGGVFGLAGPEGQPARAGLGNGLKKGLEFVGSGQAGMFLDNSWLTGLIHNKFKSPFPGRYVLAFRGGNPDVISVNAGSNGAAVLNGTFTFVEATARTISGGLLPTILWSEINENGTPYTGSNGAIFDSTAIEKPTAAFRRTGAHYFRLTGSDGTVEGFDTVVVEVP